ncbi:hypothetical protein MVEN_01470500 [Mycena venus]|uniref:Uncharacterized protein n=1 Tax=Mycena venus TaxID=2733690 RepID=A0A8H6XSB1_9AGAR|nr:hypothetical protein MVEN_01470500 [Mycena venus]
MESLPQELVNAIVYEIDNCASLKACALAGSMFRQPSQRILLSSLTLRRNFKGAHALLEKSPHVAAYVTRLSIRIENANAPSIERFFRIINKLANVRQCLLSGMKDVFGPNYHTPTLISALFDFLARQPLRELHVLSVTEAPPAVILRLLATAPLVSFYDVFVKKDPDTFSSDSTPCDGPQHARKVEDLIVEQVAHNVYELLALPRFKSYTSALRRLFVHSLDCTDPSAKLISACAATLEHIHLHLRGQVLGGPQISASALPLLRSAEFSLFFPSNAAPWFSNLVLAIVGTSPLLADIVISFIPISRRASMAGALLHGTLLTALDAALMMHSARPIIRWRFDFEPQFIEERSRAEFFAKATDVIETGMPKLREERRLVVQRYDYGEARYRRIGGTTVWSA